MPRKSATTDYARLSSRQARIVLAVVVTTFGLGIGVTLSPLASSNLKHHASDLGDADLYRAEVDRIHAGEGYYQALSTELTARGYTTRSVFNWRTPLPVWLLGTLPSAELGKGLLGILALAVMLMSFEALTREEEKELAVKPLGNSTHQAREIFKRHGRAVACVLLLIGPLMLTVLGNLFVMPELWGSVFIAISLCSYGVERPRQGMVFGLAALFFRELALPYCVVCAGIAWWHGRRREMAGWAFGLAAWLVFFGIHWWMVSGWISPNARAHREGWIQFGGAGFVISTIQMNAYLLLFPQWVTAVYFVAAMVGFAGWSTPLGTRIGLTTCLYVMAFSIVGQSFNQYWGSLIAPLFAFGLVRFPASVRDLWLATGFRISGRQECLPHCGEKRGL
jgi:hypothetical protein